jgi:hypothetical protein
MYTHKIYINTENNSTWDRAGLEEFRVEGLGFRIYTCPSMTLV